MDLFRSAGEVLNFRLVYDPQTGKARGYGFVEYPDIDSASSAVRNLHDYEIMTRKLRVDFSNERPTYEGADDSSAPTLAPVMASLPSTNGSSLPPLPGGKELPPGVTCHDAISRTLNALPPSQLLDILTQMKLLATNEPARCAELLTQAPQLSYAVFQALLLMGLVSPEAIHAVVEPTGAAPYSVTAPPPIAAPSAIAINTPPAPYNTATGSFGTPAQPQSTVANSAMPAGQDPEALMRQVMELPKETIDQLPKTERDQIMALRAQLMGQRL